MNKKTLLIVAGLCGLATSSHAELDPSLLAWYKFDEGAGATLAVDELGGTSGAVGSSVVTGIAGKAGNAYQFPDLATQAGIVDMGNASFFSGSTGLNAATAVTYSLWMNSTDSDTNRNVILYSGSDTIANSYQDLGMSGENNPGINSIDGAAHARNRPAGANVTPITPAKSAQQTGIFSTPVVIHDGSWHHVAMTIDLNTTVLSLYVDGALAAAQNFGSGVAAFPVFNNFEIGRLGRQGTQVDPYGGLVDDVQVYNAALNADQVLWLFNNPGEALTVVPEPGAVAWAVTGLCGALIACRRRTGKTARKVAFGG